MNTAYEQQGRKIKFKVKSIVLSFFKPMIALDKNRNFYVKIYKKKKQQPGGCFKLVTTHEGLGRSDINCI